MLTVSVLISAGCGDPPLCQSDVFVAFAQTMISTDVDAVAPGVQADLHLRTSLRTGEAVTLEVRGEDGTSLGTATAPVAVDGSVVFAGVSVPAPRVVLRATGRGTCGEGRDEITVDVLAGAECTVHLTPEPEVNEYYAPLGILRRQTDPDPAIAGYQATLQVVTRAGFRAEVFQTTTSEQSLGVITAGSDGIATLPVTVRDGQVGFRAICQGAGSTLASRTTTLWVDTTVPTCAVVAPMPGMTITQALDENHDITDGVQLTVAAHADGADVAGEPVTLTINPAAGAPAMLVASDTNLGGTSMAAAAFPPSTTPAEFELSLTMRDHAGNLCTSSVTYDVVYTGCAIAVTSPTAPVTRDADGSAANGSQVDVMLAVGPECVGRDVTSTCGLNSPSGIVGPDGLVTLRTDICATSPCRTEVDCAFRVSNAIGIQTEAAAAIMFDDKLLGPSP